MRTDYKTLTCTTDEGLARITLTEAKRGNPIDGDFCKDFCDLSVALSVDPSVRAVFISAEGRFFSVGGDIRAFLADRAGLPAKVLDWTASLHAGLARFQRMNAPVITAVHGDAVGGSVSLVAHSDVAFAAAGTNFVAAFTGIGYCGDSGSTVSLSNRMGLARAKRFLMLSETLTAEEAQGAGLVDFVVPAEELMAQAEKTARKLAAGPTRAYGEIKRTILSARTEPFETQLEHEAQAMARLAATDDVWEGLTAFADRRKPDFKGC
ncbi:enoyl-CoA hydratase/isomerase family protein [Mesobacterium pallidum]|uniref:enoyl-CoA hydratase/isomerase family protein n=1 Tax=Mesobacterium pallidum TaxID=2872037 RepID=UPI001EE24259|nr:enoyl-CoA hydratase-related protein [Mesobacterium pallidum]